MTKYNPNTNDTTQEGEVYAIIANHDLTEGRAPDYIHSVWLDEDDAFTWLNRHGKTLCVMGVGPDVFNREYRKKNPYFTPRVEPVPVSFLRVK